MTISMKTTAYVPSFGMSAAGTSLTFAGTRVAAAEKTAVTSRGLIAPVRAWSSPIQGADLRNGKHEGTRAWRPPAHR